MSTDFDAGQVNKFDAGAAMMSVEQALDLLAQRVVPQRRVEELPLAQCLGRVLAEDVVSPLNVPPHDNSAMDGYAFTAAHLPADGRLRRIGRSAAGHPFPGVVGPGECIRILTGAVVPASVDCVAMQEDCTVDGDFVIVGNRPQSGANCRKAGEDVAQGAVVLKSGTRLRPQEVGLAAAVGRARLAVHAPLRAAVFSTGDEINMPGTVLPPGGIYDSNRTTACGLLQSIGVQVTDLGILPDDRATIVAALDKAAADHDVILTSGGVSVGDEDHVKAAVESLGSLHFWRLAIKPGKPVALGDIRGATFIGLPGNPVAVMVVFLLLARPLLLRLMGAADTLPATIPVRADFSFRHKPGRREWLRARLVERDGQLWAEKFASESSGVLSSMVWADGLVAVPEECGDVAPGDVLQYLSFAEALR
ncbi:gephyrin-like molybdotransferase Glp [Magnetospirillum sp. 64-120]|uniref:molybdopterin molybdotransferase MoeA n=1 Tax=Magnetospirillum sp. 64-120 TaxID=1895778 RepID=UPI00092A223A|nr:gephyrin-like molybdotransferase Glp [Magnetospirillum sp. 64-120]OJX68323.1 MAG: molybdopterin molybdenumtransferase MoeA [Magnetospirillum sp. 64-120]